MILLASQGLVILVSIIVFFVVILTLVSVLLYAKSRLTPSGEVTLTVNEKREITTKPGSTVLSKIGRAHV